MRLELKFAAAMMAAAAVILAAQAVLHVRQIGQLQTREIRDDVVILSRTLSEAISKLYVTAGQEAVTAFIEQVDSARHQTALQLVQTQGLDPFPRQVRVVRRSDAWHVIATAPVEVDGKVVASIDIDRSLPQEREYYASILRTQVLTTLLAASAAGLIALFLGSRLISRPLRQLSALAHRVAEGDFSLRTQVKQRDEIGKLAGELDVMASRLAESHAKVQDEHRARTAALEQLRHADRLTTVGKLASSIAHELGTPLNVVAGRAMMIACNQNLPPEDQENARIIAQQAQRMTKIIRELLDFSRAKQLRRKRTKIRSVFEKAVSLFKPICEDKGVILEIRGDQGAAAEIDPEKILQVLTNLMMNSIHAMPKGGTITLSASREHVEAPEERHARGGHFVKLSVQDQGIGIPKDQLDSIFKAFFTTKKKGRGTGLGLSVCHGIVREHGGWLEVESDIGKGACFTVYLPETPAREDDHPGRGSLAREPA